MSGPDQAKVLRDLAADDHNRGCAGRCYSCICGYDMRVQHALIEAANEIGRLSARIVALEGALEPFAKYAEAIGYMGGPSGLFDLSLESHVIGKRELTERDFLRARTALSTPSNLDGPDHE